MFSNLVSGLFVAWLLSIFGFDAMFINACSQFGFRVDTDAYYVFFALLGVIATYIDQD